MPVHHAHGPGTATSLPLRAPVEATPPPILDDAPFRVERRPFLDFAKISARRAFRRRIQPVEVLPAERAALTLAKPPIVDRNFQAFLAWRRSVLFAVAVALVPIVVLRAVEVFLADTPAPVRGLLAVPVAVDAAFCGLAWAALRGWASWHRQRRLLAAGFLASLVAPFAVSLVPVRAILGGDAGLAAGMAFSVQATLVLAPRAVAIMAGVMRGAIVTKLLLPATPTPGWLIVLTAPVYGLVAYLALLEPYQLTGSGFFVATILALGGAAVALGRAGWQLTRSQGAAEAAAVVDRSRPLTLFALACAAAFALLALADLVEQLHLGGLALATTVATFAVNVLAITLVTTDALLATLDRARARTPENSDHQRQLASFVGAAADARTLGDVAPVRGLERAERDRADRSDRTDRNDRTDRSDRGA